MAICIDTSFNAYSDTPKGKDPDKYSATLRTYHKILWSKPLPNGELFTLSEKTPKSYLHHSSKLGDFFLSSDSIGHTYSRINATSHIIEHVSNEEIAYFFNLCSTIGAYTIFPARKVDNKMTINGSRGLNRAIRDRFDLTLECIRLYYLGEENPLMETLRRYDDFFELFASFRGYCEFFLFEDWVTEDFSGVRFLLPFYGFVNSPLPSDIDEYHRYKRNLMSFIIARNNRILSYND